MAGGPLIGEAQVGISLNDRALMSELAVTETRVRQSMDRIDRMHAEAQVEADITDVDAKMKRAEARLNHWRKLKAEAKLDVDSKEAQGQIAALEAELAALTKKKHQIKLRFEKNTVAADLAAIRGQMKGLERDASKNQTVLSRWIKNLSTMTLRVGPFTASIKQFSVAMLALGPVIMGVVGAMGSLVGVLGAGTVGMIGTMAAGFTGLGLALGGIALVMKPVLKDFKTIRTLSDAADKAVLKYGKGSKEAAKAQDQLNRALKGVSPIARQGFKDLGGLSERWQKLTTVSRGALLDSMGTAIRSTMKLMPVFARRTNEATTLISQGFQRWMSDMRSRNGRGILDDIMGNFNRTIPDATSAFRHLGEAGALFVRSFTGPQGLGKVMRVFDEFTGRLATRARHGDLDAFAGKMTDAFLAVTRFGGQATRVLAKFFGAGLGAGMGLMDKMTDGLSRLADNLGSASGQAKLAHFFEESATTAQNFFNVVKPLLSLFMEFATIMRPIANTLLQVAAGFASITAALANVGAVRTGMQVLFGGLILKGLASRASELFRYAAGLRAVAAASAAGAGAQGLATRLGGGAAAGLGASTVGAAGGAAAGRGAAAGGVQTATKQATKLGAVAGAAGGAIRGMGINPWAAAAVAAVGGVTFAFVKLQQAMDAGKKSIQAQQQGASQAFSSYRQLGDALADVASQHHRDNIAVRQAREALKGTKKGTDDYKLALLNLRDAERASTRSGSELAQTKRQYNEAASKNLTKSLQAEFAIEKQLDEQRKRKSAAEDAGRLGAAASAQQRINELEKQRVEASAAVERALNRQAVAQVNVNRGLAGMGPLAGKAAQQVGRLAQTAPRLATKIGVKFDVQSEAGGVAAAARRALGRGATVQQVVKIVGDSSSAEEAIRRVNRLHVADKRTHVSADTGDATSGIEGIRRMGIGDKEFAIGADDSDAVSKHAFVRGLPNIQKLLTVGGSTGGAMGAYNGLAALPNLSKTLTFNIITRGSVPSLGGFPKGKFTGGPILGAFTGNKWDAMTRRAAQAAAGGTVGNASSGGRYNKPKYLVGEEYRKEWVIADNPAYRERNKGFLAEAATSFGLHLTDDDGMILAKKGKGAKDKPKSKDKGKKREYKVPEAIRFGGVPLDTVQNEYQEAEGKYNDAQSDYNEYKSKDPKKRKASVLTARRDKMRRTHQAMQKRRKDLTAAQSINRDINNLNTVVDTERQNMQNAASADNPAAFEAHRVSRLDAIKKLQRLLGRAQKYAKGSALVDLNSQVASAEGERFDAMQDAMPAAEAAEPPTLDEVLKNAGLFGEFQNLNLALAREQSVMNNEGGIRSANQNIAGFWERVIHSGIISGNPELMTEAYQNLGQARSGAADSEALGGGITAEQQAGLDQAANLRTIVASGAAIENAYRGASLGAGSLGIGAVGSAPGAYGGNMPVQVNVTALHPGDPSILQQIGNAAAAGFSYQGGVSAPRTRLGY